MVEYFDATDYRKIMLHCESQILCILILMQFWPFANSAGNSMKYLSVGIYKWCKFYHYYSLRKVTNWSFDWKELLVIWFFCFLTNMDSILRIMNICCFITYCNAWYYRFKNLKPKKLVVNTIKQDFVMQRKRK